MLTFKEAGHEYRWNGERVPNVTGIIGHLTDLSRIPPKTLENARQEGVQIHKMVEMFYRQTLDPDSIPDWMAGHYKALLKFDTETGFELWGSEERVYHGKQHYAGTFDLVGVLTKLKTVRGGAIIDVKRTLYGGPAIGLQLAGYEGARNLEYMKDLKTRNRFALQLKKDGTYRLVEFADPSDHTAFLACLTMYRWKEKHHAKGK